MALKFEANIVITGFMGTGKSTVAPIVARKMQRPFIDTDDVIVERAEMGIPEIFAQHGEAWFRKLEAEVCIDMAAKSGFVVATGGGALINPLTVEAMSATSMVVCLMATPEAIEQRLEGEREGRPLATGLRERLLDRLPAYEAIPYSVDTTGKTPEQVAEEVIVLWQSIFG